MSRSGNKAHTVKHIKAVSRISFVCVSFLTAFTLGTSAWSYDIQYSGFKMSEDVSREASFDFKVPSSAVVDECKPLLTTHTHTPSELTTDGNQRTAGKVVALSMLLGARFASEPKQQARYAAPITSRQINKKEQIVDRSAFAIIAYRQCRKDRILGQVASNKI